MDIIGHRNIFLGISGSLVLASIVAMLLFGLHFGIDFLGGTLWQIKFMPGESGAATTDLLRDFLENDLKMKNPIIYSEIDTQSFIMRLSHVSEEEHRGYLDALKEKFGSVEELRFDSIGPAVGKELQKRALWGIILVLFGISLYVTFAFRKVSYPIRSWRYGGITLLTLFHDVMIPVGLFAVLGNYAAVDTDINFVVAILVVMGFSVHDTIVVFDRIRENLLSHRQTIDFPGLSGVINKSVNQTMGRSINTSLTLILVLLALFFFGPTSLKYFVLTILVGVSVGTYSSIFVASPLLLMVSGTKRNRTR